MSDLTKLSDRIDVLETRLTFQEVTIETLNNTITSQWSKIDALTRQIVNLSERLEQTDTHARDEPPPHY
jgi:SlyX protein